MSWREVEPRPSRLWVRHLPRQWPVCDRPYLDWVARRIVWPMGSGAGAAELPRLAPPGDVCWLPPVEKDRSRERTDQLATLARPDEIVLDQRIAGDSGSSSAAPFTRVVDDLLLPLVEKDLAALDAMAPNALVLVPLLPGLSDESTTWRELLARLAPRRPAAVLGVAPELSPADRRRLVDRLGESSFEAVHHSRWSAASLERAFARAVADAGLAPWWERPRLPLAPRAARHRELAAALAEAGELWLRLGRSEAEGEGLLAAARHAEVSKLDLAALAREGQLALMTVLSQLARRLIEELGREGRSSLLAELRDEYLIGEPRE